MMDSWAPSGVPNYPSSSRKPDNSKKRSPRPQQSLCVCYSEAYRPGITPLSQFGWRQAHHGDPCDGRRPRLGLAVVGGLSIAQSTLIERVNCAIDRLVLTEASAPSVDNSKKRPRPLARLVSAEDPTLFGVKSQR